MSSPRLIITSPMLSVLVAHRVDPAATPWLVNDTTVSPAGSTLDLVAAARRAGADVLFVSLVEATFVDPVAKALDALNVDRELLVAAPAARVEVSYRDAQGTVLAAVRDDRIPAAAEVDRLLDRLAAHIQRGAELVLVANDLHGAKRRDFAERVVGRAWGLGVRTLMVEGGPSLKQAFHTQPFGAVVPEGELQRISPPPCGVEETRDETLRRLFEESTRLLLVPTAAGSLLAAVRSGTRDLGPLGGVDPAVVAGAVAAQIVRDGADLLGAAEAGLRLVQS